MNRFSMGRVVAICLGVALVGACRATAADPVVAATVETTLATGSDHIRQFAFDGDPNTYFASAKNPGKKDHFTLVFDKAVSLKSLKVTTGDPKGEQILDAGALE